MSMPPSTDTVTLSIKGCHTGSTDLLRSTCADDVALAAIGRPPLHGNAQVATFWCEFSRATTARWPVDPALVQDHEVVSEWTQVWIPQGETQAARTALLS